MGSSKNTGSSIRSKEQRSHLAAHPAGVDGGLVKTLNRDRIVTHLRGGGRSRAALAVECGLTKATVSSQIAQLIDLGVVKEVGPGLSELGRKPVILEIDGNAGTAIGVRVTPDFVVGEAQDISGARIRQSSIKLCGHAPSQIVAAIIEIIEGLSSDSPSMRYGTVGVGIAVPGVVDADDESIVRSTKLGWENQSIKADLENGLGVPVHIGNDATLATIAEGHYGAAVDGDLLCVFVDEGIGAGVLMDNRIHYGKNGYFGEVGHSTIVHGGKQCACGNQGCWELYASEPAFESALAAVLGIASLSREEAIVSMRGADPRIEKVVNEYAGYFASGLVGLANTLAPSCIVLNCELFQAVPELFSAVAAAIRGRMMPYLRSCPIQVSRLGSTASSLGACKAAIDRFFLDLVGGSIERNP